MKCVVPGINMKIFARAIHSLAKVGDELYVEPSVSGVFFRTVNSSRSAFGSFFFKSSFFTLYDFKVGDRQNEDNFKCKVAMKACLNAFKSLNNIERSVEKCRLIVDPEEDRLVVNMICRHGINKTYNLSFIECETLQAVFDKTKCNFGIKSHSKVLSDAVINFQSNQEEVTLSAFPEKIVIRNYVDDDPDPAKSIHTELTLEADEFDSYDIDRNTDVTFCLKEVRSLLSFSEPANLPVALVFSQPGNPIIFTVENSPVFEANFVLATLASAPDTSQARGSQRSLASNQRRTSNVNCTDQSHKRPSEVIEENSSTVKNHTRLSESFQRIPPRDGTSPSINKTGPERISRDTPTITPRLQPPSLNTPATGSRKRLSNLSPVFRNERLEGTVPTPIRNGINGRALNRCRLEEELAVAEDQSEEDDCIPGTPPAKRKRFLFKRCFEATFDPDNLTPFQRVLAGDSDEET